MQMFFVFFNCAILVHNSYPVFSLRVESGCLTSDIFVMLLALGLTLLGRGMVRLLVFLSDKYPGVVFANMSPHVALRPKRVPSQHCPIVQQDGSG